VLIAMIEGGPAPAERTDIPAELTVRVSSGPVRAPAPPLRWTVGATARGTPCRRPAPPCPRVPPGAAAPALPVVGRRADVPAERSDGWGVLAGRAPGTLGREDPHRGGDGGV